MTKVIDNISVIIIASNEEKNIKRCLNSLSLFKEVIVYLNDSFDSTKNIISSFSNVNIFNGPFLGFSKTKEKAISKSSNDWVLIIDSDEVVDSHLINSITNISLDNSYVYKFRRKTFYKGKQINFCGMYNETIIRLFNQKITGLNNTLVHETVMQKQLNSKLLDGQIKHYSYSSISDLIQKTDSYSSLYSDQHNKYSSPLIAIIKSLFCFLKVYIFQLGFLDGYVGFLISYSFANGVFYKYLKLYEKRQDI